MIRSIRNFSVLLALMLVGCVGDPATDGTGVALEDNEEVPYDVWTRATAGCEGLGSLAFDLASVQGAPGLGALITPNGEVICVDALGVLMRELDPQMIDPLAEDPSPQPSDPSGANPAGTPGSTPYWVPTAGRSAAPDAASDDADPDSDPTPTPMFGGLDRDPTPTPMYPGAGPDSDPTPTPMLTTGTDEDPTPTPMYGGGTGN